MLLSPRNKRRLLVLVVSSLVSFAIGEIVVRLVCGSPLVERLPILEVRANATRGWEMVPNDHYTYSELVTMNALGLRGREIVPRTDETRRILCLGDSLTYGQGVGDDESIPATLETALRAADQDHAWEAVNAGHRSYATRQNVALLEELGGAIDPDLVLVLWFWNDLEEDDLEAMSERLTASGPVTFDTGDRIEGMRWWKWHAKQLLRRSALIMRLHDVRKGLYRSVIPTPKHIDAGLVHQAEYADRIVELGEEHGFKVMYGIIPDPSTLGVEPHFTKSIRDKLTAICRDRGIVVVDLEPPLHALAEEQGEPPILLYDGHYNADGNRAMGELLAPRVLALLAE